jgi:hypothetical protein
LCSYFVEGLPDEAKKVELKNLVASLPEAHRLSLQRVLYTCVLIDQKKDVNKMDAYNLATVLGT